MRLPKFEYKKATHLGEALSFYRYFDGRALFLAGGTDIIARMKLRLEKPVAIIDLKGIKELQGIREEAAYITIGSLTTLYELKQNDIIKRYFPALRAASELTSCETLQMRGTLGGNLLQETRCLFYNQSEFWRNAAGHCLKTGGEKCMVVGGVRCFSNYCSDTAIALLSLAAECKLIGPRGERKLPLFELYTGDGVRPFNIFPDEIITEIMIPYVITKGGYEKLRLRKSIDYPLLGVALSISGEKCKLSVGAVGPKPSFFIIDELSEMAIGQAAQTASEDIKPVLNTILSPLYRKRMVKVFAIRVMRKIFQGG